MKAEFQEIEKLIRNQDLGNAERRLSSLDRASRDAAGAHYLRGYLRENQSDLEGALDSYQKAAEADPNFAPSRFRMGRILNQRGEDEAAIECYEHCAAQRPASIHALMNLAILYEDQGRYEQAKRLLHAVLAEYPNHSRARAFLKDVESSIGMYVDEEHDRGGRPRTGMLDTSISEFELSMRSRNTLKQMNIFTLGDLLRTSEHDLLNYKNFGETSLNEVKRMLSSRGLRLGQQVEEEASPAETTGPATPGMTSAPVYGASPALLNRLVSEMELSVRSRKCLQRLGIATVAELIDRTEQELLATKNFGQTSLQEIKRRLTDLGLSLRNAER